MCLLRSFRPTIHFQNMKCHWEDVYKRQEEGRVKIVGVIKDFNIGGFYSELKPVSYTHLNYLMESRKTLYIVASGQEQVECSVKIFQEQYPGLRDVYKRQLQNFANSKIQPKQSNSRCLRVMFILSLIHISMYSNSQ